MPVNLSVAARDGSTYVVTLGFKDANGVAVTPKSLTWTLTDAAGLVINAREDVVATPAASVALVLSGADLYFDDGPSRVLTVKAIYDSATYGNDRPLNEEIRFSIVDLLKVHKP